MEYVPTSQPFEDEDLDFYSSSRKLNLGMSSSPYQNESSYLSISPTSDTTNLYCSKVIDDANWQSYTVLKATNTPATTTSAYLNSPTPERDQSDDEDDVKHATYRAARREERARLVRRAPLLDLPFAPTPDYSRTRPLVRRVTMAAELARRKQRARVETRRISQKLRALANETARLRRKHRALREFITDTPPRTVRLSGGLSYLRNKENSQHLYSLELALECRNKL